MVILQPKEKETEICPLLSNDINMNSLSIRRYDSMAITVNAASLMADLSNKSNHSTIFRNASIVSHDKVFPSGTLSSPVNSFNVEIIDEDCLLIIICIDKMVAPLLSVNI